MQSPGSRPTVDRNQTISSFENQNYLTRPSMLNQSYKQMNATMLTSANLQSQYLDRSPVNYVGQPLGYSRRLDMSRKSIPSKVSYGNKRVTTDGTGIIQINGQSRIKFVTGSTGQFPAMKTMKPVQSGYQVDKFRIQPIKVQNDQFFQKQLSLQNQQTIVSEQTVNNQLIEQKIEPKRNFKKKKNCQKWILIVLALLALIAVVVGILFGLGVLSFGKNQHQQDLKPSETPSNQAAPLVPGGPVIPTTTLSNQAATLVPGGPVIPTTTLSNQAATLVPGGPVIPTTTPSNQAAPSTNVKPFIPNQIILLKNYIDPQRIDLIEVEVLQPVPVSSIIEYVTLPPTMYTSTYDTSPSTMTPPSYILEHNTAPQVQNKKPNTNIKSISKPSPTQPDITPVIKPQIKPVAQPQITPTAQPQITHAAQPRITHAVQRQETPEIVPPRPQIDQNVQKPKTFIKQETNSVQPSTLVLSNIADGPYVFANLNNLREERIPEVQPKQG